MTSAEERVSRQVLKMLAVMNNTVKEAFTKIAFVTGRHVQAPTVVDALRAKHDFEGIWADLAERRERGYVDIEYFKEAALGAFDSAADAWALATVAETDRPELCAKYKEVFMRTVTSDGSDKPDESYVAASPPGETILA